MTETIKQRPLLTYQDVADRLDISLEKAKRISRLDLPRVRIGHKTIRIDPVDLQIYIQNKKDGNGSGF